MRKKDDMKTGIEINELNYELYAIDFAEGSLSAAEAKAMESFLDQHPELREEIASIAAVALPEDPVVYRDKASLKRTAGDAGAVLMVPRRWAFAAAAAVILLLIGIFGIISRGPQYGELAYDSPAYTVHYAIEHTYRIIDERRPEEMPTVHTSGSREFIGDASDSDGTAGQLQRSTDNAASGPVAFAQIQPAQGPDDPAAVMAEEGVCESVPYRLKMRIVDPAVVPEDDYFVLPVTIQLYELSEAGSREARKELDELAAREDSRDARRKMWKDGALSLLQDTFVPNGLNNLIDN